MNRCLVCGTTLETKNIRTLGDGSQVCASCYREAFDRWAGIRRPAWKISDMETYRKVEKGIPQDTDPHAPHYFAPFDDMENKRTINNAVDPGWSAIEK